MKLDQQGFTGRPSPLCFCNSTNFSIEIFDGVSRVGNFAQLKAGLRDINLPARHLFLIPLPDFLKRIVFWLSKLKIMEEPIFTERDISWLAFNHRVLQEAADPNVPLYDRLKFLAIYSTNLNEFYQVRVASMRSFSVLKKEDRPEEERKPKKILKEVQRIVAWQQTEFGRIYGKEIIPQLQEHNIYLMDDDDIAKQHIVFADQYYKDKLAQIIQPLALEKDKPTFLNNNELYLVVQLNEDVTDNKNIMLVPIPADIPARFINLPKSDGRFCVSFIDDMIRYNLPKVLPGKSIIAAYAIKVSRDAELYLGDEYDGDLIKKLKESIAKRDKGTPTRFLYDQSMPEDLLAKLKDYFQLSKNDLTPGSRYHNFNDFFGFPFPEGKPELREPSLTPLAHPVLKEGESIMDILDQQDVILHFPYQSYHYIPKLIWEAAENPAVTKIRITLYRVASKSEVTTALLHALSVGKKVIAFIEAKARFDEASNLYWGAELEKAGATVIYSYPGIKVHTKLLMISKDTTDGGQVRYAYLGTGNFNEKTAKLYCDHALITSQRKTSKEVKRIFDLLERKIIVPKCKQLLISPFTTRSGLNDLINQEIINAKAGKPAHMILKMNSLEDKDMIQKLYEASDAGVQIKLIVRGICCLIPGIAGMSENIEVLSILDRFLEHARVYLFGNGGDEKMFLASADWMTRNLDRRIEVIFPINDEAVFKELRHIIELQLNDNAKARLIVEDQSNPYKKRKPAQEKHRAQMDIYNYLKELGKLK